MTNVMRWELITATFGKRQKEKIALRRQEMDLNEKDMNAKPIEELKDSDTKALINRLINEYRRLEKLDNISFRIQKNIEKSINDKYRKRDGKDEKLSKNEFNRRLYIREWGVTKKKKQIAMTIQHWIREFNRIETFIELQLNIENLRKYDDRKRFNDQREKRFEIMQSLYEDIIRL
ncbi:hypothetical protein GLOIN_2v1824527 [Rhizophagus clarus]|uniref:Uncharacterized protein n=1 Tax=Rhizophagus clarus TaxID=94130 RepID=A0A8H3M9Q0_9GLOM|nr:hypothetical protein GLOIN_2v1824527 [Rhizophagus clarus]